MLYWIVSTQEQGPLTSCAETVLSPSILYSASLYNNNNNNSAPFAPFVVKWKNPHPLLISRMTTGITGPLVRHV